MLRGIFSGISYFFHTYYELCHFHMHLEVFIVSTSVCVLSDAVLFYFVYLLTLSILMLLSSLPNYYSTQ